MRKGKQTSIQDSLNRVLKKLDKGSGGAYRQMAAKEAWISVAGPSVVAHTTGAHLRGNELVVYVDTNVWATELSALSGQYLKRLKEELGQTAVKTIRFTVSRKVAEEMRIRMFERQAESERRKDHVVSVPLSEEELARITRSASSIEDPGLREAALRAAIADLEWKKGLKHQK